MLPTLSIVQKRWQGLTHFQSFNILSHWLVKILQKSEWIGRSGDALKLTAVTFKSRNGSFWDRNELNNGHCHILAICNNMPESYKKQSFWNRWTSIKDCSSKDFLIFWKWQKISGDGTTGGRFLTLKKEMQLGLKTDCRSCGVCPWLASAGTPTSVTEGPFMYFVFYILLTNDLLLRNNNK